MPFFGADYTLLLGYEQAGCQPLDFVVEYQGAEVYRGVIRLGTKNVRVNLRDCQFFATIEPQDAYTCLTEQWAAEFNILNGTVKKAAETILGDFVEETCTVYGSAVLPLLALGPPTGCLSGPLSSWGLKSWIIEEDVLVSPPDNIRSRAVWIQEQFNEDCDGITPVAPPGGGWQLLQDNCVPDGNALWGRPAALELVSFESTGSRYEEIYRVVGGASGIDIPNGVTLESILKVHAPCGLDIVSDFFSIDGDDTFPAGTVYTNAKANLANVLVFQKSDVRLPNAVTPASVGWITYENLLRYLKIQFDVEPRILPGGVLRLEHVDYWDAGMGLDLTASPYADLVEAALEYTYDDADLARSEKWQFMEDVGAGFSGFPIEYSGCIPADAETERVYLLDRVNNDIGFITANPDRISDDGFVFAACAITKSGAYVILSEYSIQSGLIELNAHLSISNLLNIYHRSGRMLITGKLNRNIVTFASAIARKVQVDFTILLSRSTYHSAFDAAELVETILGDGEVVTASYEAGSCSLTLSLAYP
jgi:hypothetical protein